MRTAGIVVGTAVAALLLAGCIETDTLIRVTADGSGTLTQTVAVSKEVESLLASMMQGMGVRDEDSSGSGGDEFQFVGTDQLKKDAANLGEGVRFVSAEKYETERNTGYRVVYAFDEINKLRINQNPSENMPADAAGRRTKATREMVSFRFRKRGEIATLTIRSPQADAEELRPSPNDQTSDQPDSAGVDEEQLARVREMFEGMRIAMAVEIDGEIVETNATHREGQRITVMEMDFARLLQEPERLEEFRRVNPQSVQGAKSLLHDVPGMKVDLNDKIRVKFR